MAFLRWTGPAFNTPQSRKLTVHDLLESLKADFQLEGKLSRQNESHLKRADADFGQIRALSFRPKMVDEYKQKRLANGDAKASINRPLELIRQAFVVANRREDIAYRPYIKLFDRLQNARKGFCEEPEFRRIYSFLPEHLADLALFGYCTGMRFSEILSLKWEYVRGDVIELQGEDAKGDGESDNARLIPMVGKDLAGILERRRAAQTVKTETGTKFAALIFHHHGDAIVDIRKAWKTACKKAGVPNRLFHDLRRSFCKNADEAGVSRDVAMQISGHKTQAMYSRYNIADTKRKRNALELAQEFRDAEASRTSMQANGQGIVFPMTAQK